MLTANVLAAKRSGGIGAPTVPNLKSLFDVLTFILPLHPPFFLGAVTFFSIFFELNIPIIPFKS
jgi:hypothetical protein